MIDLEGNSKPIEQIQVGEMVLARNEFEPHGPLELKRVEELFTRTSPIIELEIGGQTIGTTDEHPFYVPAREAFVPARELKAGDQLISHDGRLLRIDAIHSTLQIATVYNLRVADYHTYFVGCDDWGFSVWAHNACKEFVNAMVDAGLDSKPNAVKQAYKRILQKPMAEREALFSKYIHGKLGDVPPAQRESLLRIAMAAEPAGKKGGLRSNLIGSEGEAASSRIYGPKNNQTWKVEGWARGAKPDHVLAMDVRTRRPSVVAETKNHQEYYLSSQIERYLDLVGPNGKVIIAVPESGATIANTLKTHPQIQIDYVLPPKAFKK